MTLGGEKDKVKFIKLNDLFSKIKAWVFLKTNIIKKTTTYYLS